MDRNIELLLAKAAPPLSWEDEEKTTNDVEQLREEFRRRLYANGNVPDPVQSRNGGVQSPPQQQGQGANQ